MESKGKLTDISRDWGTGKFRLTFTVDRDVSAEVDNIREKDLRIRAVVWREKRSLSANAYYWQLVTQIADITGQTNTAVHNHMLADYGQLEIIDGHLVNIILLDAIDWLQISYIHLKPTAATKTLDDGKLYRVYHVIRGSHTYDTKEMSRLIDGMVQEAKHLGIETMTPQEIQRMLLHDKELQKRSNR